MNVKKYLGKVVSAVMISAVAISSVPVVETLGAGEYKWEINPRFEYARSFSDGLANVWDENGKWGYVDKTGKFVIVQDENGEDGSIGYVVGNYVDFSEGLAMIQGENGKWGYIDKTGEVVIPCQFLDAYSFREGLAPVQSENGKFGFVDKMGEVVISYQFEFALWFREGLAMVQGENGKWGYIDKTGEVVIPYQFDNITSFSEGLAMVGNENGEYGYIDKTGTLVIPYQFESAMSFREGLATVVVNGWDTDSNDWGWGYIDRKGEVIIPYQFEFAYNFSEGLAAVQSKNGKWGGIDKIGELAIPYEFKYVSDVRDYKDFSDGLIAIEDENGKCGFIDKKGDIVIPCQFDGAMDFREGLAAVEINGKWGYISSPYTTTKFIANSKSNKVVENTLQPKVIFNGKELNVDGDILTLNDRSYYPFRQLLESVGAEVAWDNATKTATGTLNGNKVAFTIDKSEYVVNGKTLNIDDAKLLVSNGKTYIPVRYALEGLGFTVGWDSSTGSITVE